MTSIPTEFLDAYREYDRETTIRKTRLGCFLGVILVPLFGGLDSTYSLRNSLVLLAPAIVVFGLHGRIVSADGDWPR